MLKKFQYFEIFGPKIAIAHKVSAVLLDVVKQTVVLWHDASETYFGCW